VAQLQKYRVALLASMTEKVPKGLHDMTPEEKNKVYRMPRVRVTPASEGYQASGALVPSGAIWGHLGITVARRGPSFVLRTLSASRSILS
jgi:hypothetical protein